MLDIRGVQVDLHHHLHEQVDLDVLACLTRLLLIVNLTQRGSNIFSDVQDETYPITTRPQEQSSFQTIFRNEYLQSILSDEENIPGLLTLLVLEVDVGVEVDGGSAGVLRHPVSVVDVLRDLLSLLLVHELGVGGVGPDGHRQQPVHDDVRVPPDGGGEVGVDGTSETVVFEQWFLDGSTGKVDGL